MTFVGTVGRADGWSFSPRSGEDVNVAARLVAATSAGELVLTERTYLAAGLERDPERRELTLKDVSCVVRVHVLRA